MSHHTRAQHPKQSTIRALLFIVGILFIIFIIGALFTAFYVKKQLDEGNIDTVINNKVVGEVVDKVVSKDEDKELLKVMYEAFGFKEPQTYLVLFLNNTELRPGGGFIGNYAVVDVQGTDINIVKIEGTELLDANAPTSWVKEPPPQIKEYLFVDNWYFRDSNWSPDFKVNAQRALEFYAGEGGVKADEIDAVVAITPEVLEELLSIIGPVTVEGITFNSENVTERLQFEVEHGFVDKGLTLAERKLIVGTLMREILQKTKGDILSNMQKYTRMAKRLADQKHIVVYPRKQDVFDIVHTYNWTGRVSDELDIDYILWVDANLGALKTDYVMDRHIYYTVREVDGQLEATTRMHYKHMSDINWKTSRYFSYTRLYVPVGVQLKEVYEIAEDGTKITHDLENINQGAELFKHWFGTYITVDPLTERDLVFVYTLPNRISEMMSDQNTYDLLVQKQLGTDAHGLTISVDFDTTIEEAEPQEARQFMGDTRYEYSTDLRQDRNFTVELTE